MDSRETKPHVVSIQSENATQSNTTPIDPASSTSNSNLATLRCEFFKKHSSTIARAIFLLSLAAVTLDPLFYYVFVVENAACVGIDDDLRTTVVCFRSLVDVLYIILWWHYRDMSLAPRHDMSLAPRRDMSLARRTVASLAVLPIPQVVIFVAYPDHAMRLMHMTMFIVLIQLVLRFYRIFPAYTEAIKTLPYNLRLRNAWFGAAFNLVLYMLASNVVGGFWYLRAVVRNPCLHPAEAAEAPDANHSIYAEAYETTITQRDTQFLDRFFQCFWWGLRSLSSLGQNLQMSNYTWDSFFSASIAIFGLVLFALFIGNMQAYLKTIWHKQAIKQLDPDEWYKMEQRKTYLDGWQPFKLLSEELKKEVRRCEDPKWIEMVEVNLETLLNNTPTELQEKLKPQLCKYMSEKILEFKCLSEVQKQELRDLAKPVVFPERSYIFREGEPILELVFIVHGNLWSYSKHGTQNVIHAKQLSADCLCGEDLLLQLKSVAAEQQQTPNESWLDLPIASETIQAATKVEAFALPVKDLITKCLAKRHEERA